VQANAVGTLGTSASKQAQNIGGAGNLADEQLAVSGLKAGLAGGVHVGTIDQPTADRMFSQAMRQAALIKGARDPIGATALVGRYGQERQAGDVTELANHLAPQVKQQQINGEAKKTIDYGSVLSTGSMAVKDGLVARGIAPDDATALAANAVAESSGNPAAVNPDGNSRGLFQLTGPRRQGFIDQYGVEPDKGTLDQQLDFAVNELHGKEAPAMAGISAAQGVNAKAQAASRLYLPPGLTEDDKTAAATTRGAIADRLATSGGQPDLPGMLADVKKRTAAMPLEVQLGASNKVMEMYYQNQAGLDPARADLRRSNADLMTSYQNEATDPEIPTSQINKLLPPAEAARTIEQLTIARNAGRQFAGIAMASPAEEQAARQSLAVPGATTGGSPRGRSLARPRRPWVELQARYAPMRCRGPPIRTPRRNRTPGRRR
jgi:hypothetical protein